MAKAQTVAKNKYNAKAYDDLRIIVKKGQKEVIKAHAEKHGESINAFVGRAIAETMERDSAADQSKEAHHDYKQNAPRSPGGCLLSVCRDE